MTLKKVPIQPKNQVFFPISDYISIIKTSKKELKEQLKADGYTDIRYSGKVIIEDKEIKRSKGFYATKPTK